MHHLYLMQHSWGTFDLWRIGLWMEENMDLQYSRLYLTSECHLHGVCLSCWTFMLWIHMSEWPLCSLQIYLILSDYISKPFCPMNIRRQRMRLGCLIGLIWLQRYNPCMFLLSSHFYNSSQPFIPISRVLEDSSFTQTHFSLTMFAQELSDLPM